MTLENLCAALATSILVTVLDSDGTELLKFFSGGYAEVDSTLLARVVEKIEPGKKLTETSFTLTLAETEIPSA